MRRSVVTLAVCGLLVVVGWGACDFNSAVSGYCGRNPQLCGDAGVPDGGAGDGGVDCTGADACVLTQCAGQSCAGGSVCVAGGCTCVAVSRVAGEAPHWLDMVGGPAVPHILVGSADAGPLYGVCLNCTDRDAGFLFSQPPLPALAFGRLAHGGLNEAIVGVSPGATSPSLLYAECSAVCYRTANWSAAVHIATPVDSSVAPSVAADQNSTAILYSAAAGFYSVVECADGGCSDAAAWSAPRPVTSSPGLASPATALLALGPRGQAAFVGNQFLTCAPGCAAWAANTLPGGPARWQGSLKAVTGLFGAPHFALLDTKGGVTRGACVSSPCVGGAWDVSTVATDGLGGTTIGFDVDPQGTEQIAYWGTGGLSLISVQPDGGASQTSLETCGLAAGVGVGLVAGQTPPAILFGTDSGVYFTVAP